MKNQNLVKIIAGAIFSIANIFPLPKCYSSSSKVPFTETPLYKHLIKEPDEKIKLYEKKSPESLESKIQIIEEKVEKKTEEGITEKPEEKPLKYKPSTQPYQQLNLTNPPMFNPNMTFEEAIDILRNSVDPPLNIVVLWRNLENANIYRNTPIGIEGVSNIPLRTHLEILLTSLSAGSSAKLNYVVEGRIITIATEDTLKKQDTSQNRMTAQKIIQVYDISDLIGMPANYFTPPRVGMMGYGLGGFGGGYGYSPFIMGGYRTNVGRIRIGTSLNMLPNIMGSYTYPSNRGQDLVGLIEKHTFDSNRRSR